MFNNRNYKLVYILFAYNFFLEKEIMIMACEDPEKLEEYMNDLILQLQLGDKDLMVDLNSFDIRSVSLLK